MIRRYENSNNRKDISNEYISLVSRETYSPAATVARIQYRTMAFIIFLLSWYSVSCLCVVILTSTYCLLFSLISVCVFMRADVVVQVHIPRSGPEVGFSCGRDTGPKM